MKLPSLRGHGLRPSTMKARLRRRWRVPDISRWRLRRFLAGIPRPLPDLPGRAPASVAVVVPCFRHAAYLPQALASVLAQSRLPDELILVDDCSPDDTGQILRDFAAAHSWPGGGPLVLVNERNLGQAASLNRAIEAARSELIVVLNDDDYLMHDAVEAVIELFGRHPELGLVGSGNVSFAGDETLAAASKSSDAHGAADAPLRIHTPDEVPAYGRGWGVDMTHTSCSFWRACWQAVGGYYSDKSRRVIPFSDRDFQLRVNALWPVGVLYERPLSFWRHDSSVDGKLNS